MPARRQRQAVGKPRGRRTSTVPKTNASTDRPTSLLAFARDDAYNEAFGQLRCVMRVGSAHAHRRSSIKLNLHMLPDNKKGVSMYECCT